MPKRRSRFLGLEAKTDKLFECVNALDPVFIAVDLEAYEFNQRRITEVGVAKLDSCHLPPLSETSPGKWLCQIRTNHYLMKDYQKHVNKKHVKGCPDEFLFGDSQHCITPKMMPTILKDEFTIPDVREELNIDDWPAFQGGEKSNRNIVLVGHNISGDIKYLNTIGFSLFRQGVVGLVDTERLARAINLPQGLEKLLLAMGEKPEYLHNAGNDAHYAMQAAVLMALYGHVLPVPPVMDAARQIILERDRVEKAKEEKAAAAREAKALRRAEERKNETEAAGENRLEA
ncbi:putative qde-2-interacting protein [Neofusicoccum parvum UCRNP2]|uniref:Putative qde-2-interacting protein n=1 Tax=Botryosphaeria parva (strain UCR-NP2) TaxID=1287680 RepID=R1ETV1_BOTPV|nr:putative qde-2-interacting protein [Neofusicoccum parvum UCRNP2]